MQDMTREQMHARTGEPTKRQIVREDGAPLDLGVPPEAIVPVWLGLGSDEISLSDAAIMIAGFGEELDPAVTKRTWLICRDYLRLRKHALQSAQEYMSPFLSREIYGLLHVPSGFFFALGACSKLSPSLRTRLLLNTLRCWVSYPGDGGAGGRNGELVR